MGTKDKILAFTRQMVRDGQAEFDRQMAKKTGGNPVEETMSKKHLGLFTDEERRQIAREREEERAAEKARLAKFAGRTWTRDEAVDLLCDLLDSIGHSEGDLESWGFEQVQEDEYRAFFEANKAAWLARVSAKGGKS